MSGRIQRLVRRDAHSCPVSFSVSFAAIPRTIGSRIAHRKAARLRSRRKHPRTRRAASCTSSVAATVAPINSEALQPSRVASSWATSACSVLASRESWAARAGCKSPSRASAAAISPSDICARERGAPLLLETYYCGQQRASLPPNERRAQHVCVRCGRYARAGAPVGLPVCNRMYARARCAHV